MKTIPALLVAAALISTAFAQNVALHPNPALQDAQKRHPGPIAIQAIKPILLHTGKPISANDKTQLVLSAKKMYAANMPVQKSWQKPNIKATDTTPTITDVIITPTQMFQKDLIVGQAYSPVFVSPGDNELLFGHSISSNLVVTFTAKANMIYTIAFKVNALSANQQFTIADSAGNGTSFTGSVNSNEFAYAVVASSAGSFSIQLYSLSDEWLFNSCEITATPIN